MRIEKVSLWSNFHRMLLFDKRLIIKMILFKKTRNRACFSGWVSCTWARTHNNNNEKPQRNSKSSSAGHLSIYTSSGLPSPLQSQHTRATDGCIWRCLGVMPLSAVCNISSFIHSVYVLRFSVLLSYYIIFFSAVLVVSLYIWFVVVVSGFVPRHSPSCDARSVLSHDASTKEVALCALVLLLLLPNHQNDVILGAIRHNTPRKRESSKREKEIPATAAGSSRSPVGCCWSAGHSCRPLIIFF